MKKLLLTLCLFLAASVGQSFAANTPNAASKQATANDNITGNDLKGNKRFTVQVSTGEGGQIEIMGTGAISNNSVASATINTGEDVQLLITPQSGYALKTFYVDGANVLSNVGTDGIYTIQAISKNISVSCITTFLSPTSPTKLGKAISPLTISAIINIKSNERNGPIATNAINIILYGNIAFTPAKYCIHFSP